MIRVFLILAQPVTRAGLRNCLSGQADVRVVGEDSHVESAWSRIERLAPDVIVIDGTALADLHAQRRLPVIGTGGKPAAVVLFTSRDAMAGLDRAQQAGLRGFVDAEMTPEAMVDALREVARGGRFVAPALMPEAETAAGAGGGVHPAPEKVLSARELEVFELTADGLESKEIGDRLDISPRTVDVHRTNIRQKLNLSGVHELMRFALLWKQDRERSGRQNGFCGEHRPLLLVEDDEVDILSARRALARLPTRFPIATARDGEDALRWLRGGGHPPPFMVVLDISMPRMGGHEFLEELRADPALGCLPVIVLTNSRHDEDRSRLFRKGVLGYLVKPTTSAEYYELFRSVAEYWGFNYPPPAPVPARAA